MALTYVSLTRFLRSQNIHYISIPNSRDIRIACPECKRLGIYDGDDPKLYVNPYKKLGHCFRCGWKSHEEKDLLNLFNIRDIYHGEIMPAVEAPQKIKFISPLPLEAFPAFQNKTARAYLASRGLSIDDMKKFGFFFCKDGFYEGRVIAPVCDRKGNYRTWVSRSISDTVDKKYLYPKGTATSRLLYNLHFVKQTNAVWIVEGIFDSLHCYPYAVASFGKQISQAQISLLRLHGITTVYLMWDCEAWKQTPELWERAVNKLKQYFFTFPVKLPCDTPTEFKLPDLKWMCRSL